MRNRSVSAMTRLQEHHKTNKGIPMQTAELTTFI